LRLFRGGLGEVSKGKIGENYTEQNPKLDFRYSIFLFKNSSK